MGEAKWDYTTGWETTEVCEQCGRTFRQTVNIPGAGMDGCAGWVPGRSLCAECAPRLAYTTDADPGDERPEPAMQTADMLASVLYVWRCMSCEQLTAELAQARADLARVTGERDEALTTRDQAELCERAATEFAVDVVNSVAVRLGVDVGDADSDEEELANVLEAVEDVVSQCDAARDEAAALRAVARAAVAFGHAPMDDSPEYWDALNYLADVILALPADVRTRLEGQA